MPNFKLKYDNLENVKTDRVNTAFSTYIKSNGQSFFGTPGSILVKSNIKLFVEFTNGNLFQKFVDHGRSWRNLTVGHCCTQLGVWGAL